MAVYGEETHCRHDHSRCAVRALHRFLVEERLLHRMELVSSGNAFDGDNLLRADRPSSGDAGSLGFSIDENGAGATLALPAAVLASRQVEMIAQDGKQAGLWICFYRVGVSVDGETNHSHKKTSIDDCPGE
jgi:hypothetical protein